METVLRPHLSQAVTEIGYQREPCRFSNCDLCEHWFEAKAKASGVPIDARIAPDADG